MTSSVGQSEPRPDAWDDSPPISPARAPDSPTSSATSEGAVSEGTTASGCGGSGGDGSSSVAAGAAATPAAAAAATARAEVADKVGQRSPSLVPQALPRPDNRRGPAALDTALTASEDRVFSTTDEESHVTASPRVGGSRQAPAVASPTRSPASPAAAPGGADGDVTRSPLRSARTLGARLGAAPAHKRLGTGQHLNLSKQVRTRGASLNIAMPALLLPPNLTGGGLFTRRGSFSAASSRTASSSSGSSSTSQTERIGHAGAPAASARAPAKGAKAGAKAGAKTARANAQRAPFDAAEEARRINALISRRNSLGTETYRERRASIDAQSPGLRVKKEVYKSDLELDLEEEAREINELVALRKIERERLQPFYKGTPGKANLVQSIQTERTSRGEKGGFLAPSPRERHVRPAIGGRRRARDDDGSETSGGESPVGSPMLGPTIVAPAASTRRLRFSGEIMEDIILPMQAHAAASAADEQAASGAGGAGGATTGGGTTAGNGAATPLAVTDVTVSGVAGDGPAAETQTTSLPGAGVWEENPKGEFEKSRPPSRRLSVRKIELTPAAADADAADDGTAGEDAAHEEGDWVGPAPPVSLRTRGSQRAARRFQLLKREREISRNATGRAVLAVGV